MSISPHSVTPMLPRMAKVLTPKGIEAAEPKNVRYELPDAGLPSFYLVVQPSGAKSFCVRYRAKGKKTRKLTIGAYPKFSLEVARGLAREAIANVARGIDPAEEKAARKRSGAKPETIEDLAAQFIERHAKQNTREITWKETERMLRLHVLPKWKARHFDDIEHSDVISLFEGIDTDNKKIDKQLESAKEKDKGKLRRKKVSAYHVLAATRKMFNWAIEKGILKKSSPCVQVKTSKVVSGDRVLSDDELHLVWAASAKLKAPFGSYLQMLILTMQRRNEVSGMCWSEVDMKAATWTLPAMRTKNKQKHTLPLPNAAMTILETLPRECDFVFTTTGETPISGFAKFKRALDKMIAADNGEAIAPWRFHDLRRTGASKMPELGVELPVVERIMNHTSGSFAGIVSVYQKYKYLREMREALEKWADFL